MLNKKDVENELILVEVENLSLNDEFMSYVPKTEEEKNTKLLIIEALSKNVRNFYRPKYDPSYTDDETGICFVAGKRPAVEKSYDWWVENARKYDSKRNSRLGTALEYGAFLGVLIKKLVEEGMPVESAWNAVCNDSKELGHYWNSENPKHNFENTGSREVCGFYDLGNTFKFLAEDIESGGFWVAGGYFYYQSNVKPIAKLCRGDRRKVGYGCAVGWVVLS